MKNTLSLSILGRPSINLLCQCGSLLSFSRYALLRYTSLYHLKSWREEHLRLERNLVSRSLIWSDNPVKYFVNVQSRARTAQTPDLLNVIFLSNIFLSGIFLTLSEIIFLHPLSFLVRYWTKTFAIIIWLLIFVLYVEAALAICWIALKIGCSLISAKVHSYIDLGWLFSTNLGIFFNYHILRSWLSIIRPSWVLILNSYFIDLEFYVRN